MKRRIYSLALVLCMLIGMFPMQAFASPIIPTVDYYGLVGLIEDAAAKAEANNGAASVTFYPAEPFNWPANGVLTIPKNVHVSTSKSLEIPTGATVIFALNSGRLTANELTIKGNIQTSGSSQDSVLSRCKKVIIGAGASFYYMRDGQKYNSPGHNIQEGMVWEVLKGATLDARISLGGTLTGEGTVAGNVTTQGGFTSSPRNAVVSGNLTFTNSLSVGNDGGSEVYADTITIPAGSHIKVAPGGSVNVKKKEDTIYLNGKIECLSDDDGRGLIAFSKAGKLIMGEGSEIILNDKARIRQNFVEGSPNEENISQFPCIIDGEGIIKIYADESLYSLFDRDVDTEIAKVEDPDILSVTELFIDVENIEIWRSWYCDHDWDDGVISNDPTCQEFVELTYTCSKCGGTKTEETYIFGQHQWETEYSADETSHWFDCKYCDERNEVTEHISNNETDCTKAEICTVCEYVIREATAHNWDTNDCTEEAHCTNDGCNETREAGQHSWGEWTETKAPDCENLGEKAHTCQNSACGKTETEFVDMLGHDWDSIVVQPTCTEGGYKINFCKRDNCGHSYNSDVKASLGHAWDEGVVTKEPTATEDGVKTYSCTREGCNATKTEAISKLPKQNIIWTTQWADPTLSPNVSFTYGEATSHTNEAINMDIEDCVFTYASSDETVATVDEDGKVTIIGAGECEITATAPAVDGEFAETTIGYHLSVLKKPITVKANDHAIVYGEAPANNGWTANGLADGDTLTGTAVYTYNYEQYGKAGSYEISLSGLVNDNYDITFVKGTLTVNKASEYALTLSDLSQYVGDITGAKVNIAPQDTTAQFKVEYEMVTAAVPCGHKHDDACGGEAECNHAHNEACGYKAEVRTWTETAPTVKGEYNVRASLLSSDNIIVNAENIATGTFEVKTRASIGGGGSAPSGGNGGSLDVESGNKDVSVEVEVKDGTVEVIVTENDLDKIIENIPETGEVVVDLTSVDNAKELVIPGELVSALDKNEDAKQLTIVSESAEIVMDENVMGTLAETIKSENDKVSVELTGVKTEDLSKEQQAVVNSIAANPVIVELNLVVNHYDENGSKTGETKLHELGGDVEVAVEYKLPAGMEGRNVVAAYINDEGHVQYMRAKYIDGKVVFTTDHFSVYVVTAMKAAIFEDIDLNGWYTPSVEWAVINGITEGTTETTFAPDMVCTRAQAVTFLYRAAGSPAVKGDMPFADVAENAYYYNAVLWAVNNGITKGVSEKEFAPDAVCTREQIVTFLYNTAVSLGKDVSVGEDTNILSYDDAFGIGEWAIPAMQWAVGEGVMTGTSESTLSPKMECTRAQIVTFLARAFGE